MNEWADEMSFGVCDEYELIRGTVLAKKDILINSWFAGVFFLRINKSTFKV